MKFLKFFSNAVLTIALPATLLTAGCKKDQNKNPEQAEACEVQLFDGDNFKDDHITLKGPGEFPDMNKLPGAKKDWDDEADSFKAGKNAIVTIWTAPDFEGDSTVYDAGAQKATLSNEPRSMKIRCTADEK